jgi:excisionase family DNA binding protein
MSASGEYLKAREVAAMLSMDISAIYKLCDSKVIPSIRIGQKAVRIPRAALDAYLAKQAGEPRQGRALLENARQHGDDPLVALERQAHDFSERAGCSVHEFVDRWRAKDIEDTPETADLLIDALSLRSALDRTAVGDAVFA